MLAPENHKSNQNCTSNGRALPHRAHYTRHFLKAEQSLFANLLLVVLQKLLIKVCGVLSNHLEAIQLLHITDK